MLVKNSKLSATLVLLAVITLAFAVRFYSFHDWLYFKMDQARDALLISQAVEKGAEYLPLLGPRAGATDLKHGYLRLGPIFYYFQYLSGKIFNSISPDVFAYPDLFFAVLTIPLLYLLVRIYFDRFRSFFIVGMYAFSFLVIQYSRFAWNPNALQFFLILSFFGLLKFVNEDQEKKKKWWIMLWALGLSVGSQLHFFGFFSLLGISGLVLFFNLELWRENGRQNIFQKAMIKNFLIYAAIFLGVFSLIYVPVIASDVMNKGENSKNFIEALGSKPAKKTFSEKLSKNIEENLKYNCLIITSGCYQGGYGKNEKLFWATGAILIIGLVSAILLFRKEKEKRRRNFLFLVLSWFLVFFILTFPVSFQLRPRFFIIVFALPFILIAIFSVWLEQKIGQKKNRVIFSAIAAMTIALNLSGTYAWFQEMAESQIKSGSADRTLILLTKDGVTLGQLEKVADFIYARRKPGAHVYYYVKPEHVAPLKYLFRMKGDPDFIFSPLKINSDPQAQYFAVTPAYRGTEPVEEKFNTKLNVLASLDAGQLAVFEIDFPNRNIKSDLRFNKGKSGTDRLFWKDIFNSGEKDNFSQILDADE